MTNDPVSGVSSPQSQEPGDGGGSRPLPVVTLAWVFLKIGTLAIGDTGPVLAMIDHDLVKGYRVLTPAEVTEALTYTKLLPGSTVVQIVAYLAYKIGGWPGSALATAAYLLPSALAMVFLAIGYVAVTSLAVLRPALGGLTAAAVGILLATAYRFGKRNIDLQEPVTVGLALLTFVAGTFFGINAALLVVIAGLVGILVFTVPPVALAAHRNQP